MPLFDRECRFFSRNKMRSKNLKLPMITFKQSYCQNPNLTTTQPNLILVGFDTIIALHTHPAPHHPTTNSISTRKNDPRGMKFCTGFMKNFQIGNAFVYSISVVDLVGRI